MKIKKVTKESIIELLKEQEGTQEAKKKDDIALRMLPYLTTSEVSNAKGIIDNLSAGKDSRTKMLTSLAQISDPDSFKAIYKIMTDNPEVFNLSPQETTVYKQYPDQIYQVLLKEKIPLVKGVGAQGPDPRLAILTKKIEKLFGARPTGKLSTVQKDIDALRAQQPSFAQEAPREKHTTLRNLRNIFNWLQKNPQIVADYVTNKDKLDASAQQKEPVSSQKKPAYDPDIIEDQPASDTRVQPAPTPQPYPSSAPQKRQASVGIFRKDGEDEFGLDESWSVRNKNKYAQNLFERLIKNINIRGNK